MNFSAVKVGDVVAVRGTRTGTSPTATSPIAATAITIEVPSISGRVQSVSGDTVTLVTGDGQLEYVTLSGSTAYHGVRGASATIAARSRPASSSWPRARRSSLTTLNADDVQVLGTSELHAAWLPGPLRDVPVPPSHRAAAKSV